MYLFSTSTHCDSTFVIWYDVLTGGKHLLLPHLLLLEEVLEQSLVTGAHFGLQTILKRNRTQEMPWQSMLALY